MMRVFAAALAVFVLAGAAQAKEIVVQVDAKAGPWLVKANKEMKYGIGDNAPPVIVSGLGPGMLGSLEIYADGTTVAGGAAVDGTGVPDTAVDDQKGPKGKFYPSFYTPKILYPANAHALIGAFVDADGVLVSRPFVIGTGVRVPIPETAVALALGFNDVSFAGNSGSLTVTLVTPED
ncbi:hypothetical protein ABAC460_07260 [Asticcacaulis sp. AC460]|uniref:hypothetical protein n=1 Tax=Asticcacaulis sp. AC460 TaxID=1282360 RepID=UPI0003C3DF54|nr:hypothetical protein [Asticcacaulis sp. AC460]ESQ91358.1 hypothetical protein ABAC460_07260 [Asticcacaulis sp. AC460]